VSYFQVQFSFGHNKNKIISNKILGNFCLPQYLRLSGGQSKTRALMKKQLRKDFSSSLYHFHKAEMKRKFVRHSDRNLEASLCREEVKARFYHHPETGSDQ
jgi:hypothetical protein